MMGQGRDRGGDEDEDGGVEGEEVNMKARVEMELEFKNRVTISLVLG